MDINKMGKKDTDSKTDLAVIKEKVETMKSGIERIESRLERSYVTKEEFDPVKKIVYGLVGLILVAVVTALIALIIRKPV